MYFIQSDISGRDKLVVGDVRFCSKYITNFTSEDQLVWQTLIDQPAGLHAKFNYGLRYKNTCK